MYAKEVDFSQAPNLLACLPIGAQLCKHCRPSLMNKTLLWPAGAGTVKSRSCMFSSALKRCAGACCGKESHEEHGYACASLWSVCGWCVGLGKGGGAERTAPGNDSISYYSKLAWLGAVNSLEEATTLIRTPAGLITTVIKFFVSRCFPVTMKY